MDYFNCIVLTVYGGELINNTGQLASPLYPGNYPHNVHYVWTISVDLGMQIRVTFQDMDIEESWNSMCIYDYLKV